MLMRFMRSFAIIRKPIFKAEEAIKEIPLGSSISIGGFGSCGTPFSLVKSLFLHSHINGLTIICNDVGPDYYHPNAVTNEIYGISSLIQNNQVTKIITSYIGDSESTIERYNKGDLNINFISQVH